MTIDLFVYTAEAPLTAGALLERLERCEWQLAVRGADGALAADAPLEGALELVGWPATAPQGVATAAAAGELSDELLGEVGVCELIVSAAELDPEELDGLDADLRGRLEEARTCYAVCAPAGSPAELTPELQDLVFEALGADGVTQVDGVFEAAPSDEAAGDQAELSPRSGRTASRRLPVGAEVSDLTDEEWGRVVPLLFGKEPPPEAARRRLLSAEEDPDGAAVVWVAYGLPGGDGTPHRLAREAALVDRDLDLQALEREAVSTLVARGERPAWQIEELADLEGSERVLVRRGDVCAASDLLDPEALEEAAELLDLPTSHLFVLIPGQASLVVCRADWDALEAASELHDDLLAEMHDPIDVSYGWDGERLRAIR